MIHQLTDELDSFLPRFSLNGSQIEIIDSPQDFQSRLVSMISQAKSRIFLSSLYISKDAYSLRHTIREALQNHPSLKLLIIMDALRGTRSDHLCHQDGGDFFKHMPQATTNSTPASMILPLLSEFGSSRVEVRFYHTPNLRGLWKRLLPKRFNEGLGLQHTKVYGVDNEVVISGANLSHEYFTNRQDRYYHFSSEEMCDYFQDISRAIGDLSYRLVCNPLTGDGYSLEWPSTNYCASPLEESNQFGEITKEVLGQLIRRPAFEKKPQTFEDEEFDTIVYPIAQFAPLLGHGESTHQEAIAVLLSALCGEILAGARWTLSTPYFNLTPFLRSAFVSTTAKLGVMITGAPQATCFYGTAGLTGYIPSAFTSEVRRFLINVEKSHREDQVHLMEWQRGRGDLPGGWTYHAKGIWVTKQGEEDPCITVIGSSNYGERSLALDLEQDAIVVTKNAGLKKRIGDEERRIMKHSRRVTRNKLSTEDRKTTLLVTILLWIIRLIGASI